MTEHPITSRRLVLHVPDMHRVSADLDVDFETRTSPRLVMDIYRPPGRPTASLPAVVFVSGYADPGGRERLGCNLKDWAAYRDWARLVASHGMIAITYTNEDPLDDARKLIRHVRARAEALGVDASRMALWACSGNVPTALAVLGEDDGFECAALCYGYTLDAPGNDDVARAAVQFGFAHATARMSAGELPDVPMLVVRAGRDEMPGLNASLDRFLAASLDANLGIELFNHREGAHAFDISDAGDESKLAVRRIVEFLRSRLAA